jgi:FGGY-family pentulose kinase
VTDRFYLGIDVGTGSARAAIFDGRGARRGMGVFPIQIWRPQTDFVEQSSEDIWRACGSAVRAALSEAGITGAQIAGIGFDATCSLVALDINNRPVTVSPTGQAQQNVIVWMDHRALAEAESINATGHRVLKYVGGVISPEMQTPKLLWLKNNLKDSWSKTARFFDLPDYLTYRATGIDTRSLCTAVCKWTYLGHEGGEQGGWDPSYFHQIGLSDLVNEGFVRIGKRIRHMGERIGALTASAADDLGLVEGIPVGVSIIDAHAGGLGLLGSVIDAKAVDEAGLELRLALIGGTSSCHMAVSREPRYPAGIWGPYYSAMIPGMWLTEGGQSATGALIDHVIHSHVRGTEFAAQAKTDSMTVYEVLNRRLEQMAGAIDFPAALTRSLHVLPYFHGNRSPLADPTLRGMISGLQLTDSFDSLALLYLATVQAIAYGTRHIIDTMNASGYQIRTILACGGDIKNPVFVREHADITGCRIVLPAESEAVLLGSAILGAVASQDHPSLLCAMTAMNKAGERIEPAQGSIRDYHDKKYRVFRRMVQDQIAYRRLMEG